MRNTSAGNKSSAVIGMASSSKTKFKEIEFKTNNNEVKDLLNQTMHNPVRKDSRSNRMTIRKTSENVRLISPKRHALNFCNLKDFEL